MINVVARAIFCFSFYPSFYTCKDTRRLVEACSIGMEMDCVAH
jgi:hypothetical protein